MSGTFSSLNKWFKANKLQYILTKQMLENKTCINVHARHVNKETIEEANMPEFLVPQIDSNLNVKKDTLNILLLYQVHPSHSNHS
jgi:hypothetical protein